VNIRPLLWLLLAAACVPAFADTPSADLVTHIRQVVAQTAGSSGIFVVQDDGSVRHQQSGLVCPVDFPNVHFAQIQIYRPDGTDIGCDYARVIADGSAVSKLTIFSAKAPDGATLDSVFVRYKDEIVRVHPDAVEENPSSLSITDSTGDKRTDYRSAGYSITIEGKHFHSELIVGLVKGWMIEVRATYPNSVVQVDKNTTKDEIRDQVTDIESPYMAFMSAQDSLTGSSP